MTPPNDYHAPLWLPGGHAQTLYPTLVPPALPAYRRERWDTPDGDFIDVDWTTAPAAPHAPLVVLFHGLEGGSASPYARALMAAAAAGGAHGVVPHFRGCSGEPNRAPRAYHSGDSAEIDWIVRRLAARHAGRVYVAGVSLGGNALLKWLGEQGDAARAVVEAAAAVCAPLDLTAAGLALERGFNRVYTRHFLVTLKRSALAKLDRHPGLFDGRAARRAATLRAFDDAVTAPLHGFRDWADYWRRASSKPLLPGIRVPTLLLNPLNDPFLPATALPGEAEVSSAVRREYPAQGGHVGFVSGPFPGGLDWLPSRLLRFFDLAV